MLIHQAVIAGETGREVAVVIRIGFFRGKSGMGQKAQGAEPVINGYDDDAVLDHHGRIVIVALAGNQRPTVDPDHHRAQREKFARAGSKHVEEQAIFGDAQDAEG